MGIWRYVQVEGEVLVSPLKLHEGHMLLIKLNGFPKSHLVRIQLSEVFTQLPRPVFDIGKRPDKVRESCRLILICLPLEAW